MHTMQSLQNHQALSTNLADQKRASSTLDWHIQALAHMSALASAHTARKASPAGAHPVLTSQAVVPWWPIFSASMDAYFMGCHIRNAPPKHALNVASGSVTPTSVPATWRAQRQQPGQVAAQ